MDRLAAISSFGLIVYTPIREGLSTLRLMQMGNWKHGGTECNGTAPQV
jgi:hypothetical protein